MGWKESTFFLPFLLLGGVGGTRERVVGVGLVRSPLLVAGWHRLLEGVDGGVQVRVVDEVGGVLQVEVPGVADLLRCLQDACETRKVMFLVYSLFLLEWFCFFLF